MSLSFCCGWAAPIVVPFVCVCFVLDVVVVVVVLEGFTLLSQWYFSHGKFRSLSPRKANCDRIAVPNLKSVIASLVHAAFLFDHTTGFQA